MLKSRGILFDIENLSIDGTSFAEDDDLNRHLLIGENLFAYVKNIKPKVGIISDIQGTGYNTYSRNYIRYPRDRI